MLRHTNIKRNCGGRWARLRERESLGMIEMGNGRYTGHKGK